MDEPTRERTARLRAAGVKMCGPRPPTDADLDVVEDFVAQLRGGRLARVDTSARVRAVADPLIERGYTPEMIYTAVMQALGLGIGRGAQGPDRTALYPGPLGDTPVCPYCGATGDGGHGGFCPTAARGS